MHAASPATPLVLLRHSRRMRLACLALLLAASAGCQEFPSFAKLNPFADSEEVVVSNVKDALQGKEGHSRLVGDYITIRSGLQMYVIEGIGLVTGLNGTGSDPGPPYREILLDDMRRRKFPRPELFLQSPDNALVLVRAYVPPLIKKGDRIDIEVSVPDGGGARSLRGGVLLDCTLTELAYAPGRGMLEGKVLAHAAGPILNADLGEDSTGEFLRGSIPGGGVYVGADRDLSVQLLRDYANARMSTRIADRVGKRFYDYDKSGIQHPLAEAKTHSRIQLQVHRRYADNYPRYLQCIRHIQLRESPVERNLRMQRLGEELLNPATTLTASLELEAIGREAIPTLKTALQASDLEPRFCAAQALAYLGDTSGVDALVEAAEHEPAFRVYALAALAATASPEAVVGLQPLLNHESLETKYGAFRAITTIAPDDPSVAGRPMQGGYSLHVLPTTGKPVAHFTQRRKCEIVLFGADQRLTTPVVIRAGSHIMIRSTPAGDRLVVSRFTPDGRERRQEISTRLADLILTVDTLGALYPDVVQMLVEADRQANLPGRLGIDALPQAGRTYQRRDSDGRPTDAAPQAGGVNDTPNLFDTSDPSQNAVVGPSDEAVDEEAGSLGAVGFVTDQG